MGRAVELASGPLQASQKSLSFIHSLAHSFTYLMITNYVSGIGLVAGNIAHRNTMQTLEFTVQLSEDLLDVAKIESGVQLLKLIIIRMEVWKEK